MADRKTLLVLFGSPHQNGATARLLEEFLQAVDRETEIAVIDAYRENIRPCVACGFCKTREACSFSDMDSIDGLLRRADFLVVASPVYNLSFPAPLKAILDRTQRYFEARFSLRKKPPIEKPKRAVLLATAGSENADGAAIMEKQLRMIFSVMNTRLESVVALTGLDGESGGEGFLRAARQARKAALAMQDKI